MKKDHLSLKQTNLSSANTRAYKICGNIGANEKQDLTLIKNIQRKTTNTVLEKEFHFAFEDYGTKKFFFVC